MNTTKLKWITGKKENGPQTLRCHRSACGRFEVVEIMAGPWGSTWRAYDLHTGDEHGGMHAKLTECKTWCAAR